MMIVKIVAEPWNTGQRDTAKGNGWSVQSKRIRTSGVEDTAEKHREIGAQKAKGESTTGLPPRMNVQGGYTEKCTMQSP